MKLFFKNNSINIHYRICAKSRLPYNANRLHILPVLFRKETTTKILSRAENTSSGMNLEPLQGSIEIQVRLQFSVTIVTPNPMITFNTLHSTYTVISITPISDNTHVLIILKKSKAHSSNAI